MVVYYVLQESEEYSGVLGIYSDKEKAIEKAKFGMRDYLYAWDEEGNEEEMEVTEEYLVEGIMKGRIIYRINYNKERDDHCTISVFREKVQ